MVVETPENQSQQIINNPPSQQTQTAKTPSIKPKRNSFLTIVLALLFLLMAGGLGFLGYQNYLLRARISNLESENKVSELQEAAPSSETKISKIYKLGLNLKKEGQYPPLIVSGSGKETLAGYLGSLIGIKEGLKIYYDARTTEPFGSERNLFNSFIYLVLSEPVALEKKYEDSYSEVTTEPADSNLAFYFSRTDYCEKDSECKVAFNGCSYGAYNHYRSFLDAYGCGAPSYKDQYPNYDSYSEELVCYIKMEFEGAKCQNNVCVETGVEQVCQ